MMICCKFFRLQIGAGCRKCAGDLTWRPCKLSRGLGFRFGQTWGHCCVSVSSQFLVLMNKRRFTATALVDQVSSHLHFHSNSLQTGLPASAHTLQSVLSRAARVGLLKCQLDYATQTFQQIQVQNPNCGPRGSSGYEPRVPLPPHLLSFPAAHLALSSLIPSLESYPLEYGHEDRTLPCALLNLQCWHLTNICE